MQRTSYARGYWPIYARVFAHKKLARGSDESVKRGGGTVYKALAISGIPILGSPGACESISLAAWLYSSDLRRTLQRLKTPCHTV